jgi:hypothetical protein
MIFSLAVTLITIGALDAQPSGKLPTEKPVPVNPDNFNRTECDMVFGRHVKDAGLGNFVHHRELMPIDYPVVRPNRDTLYSLSVFDLDAGPVTIILPDAGKRFMSMQVIDEDQYTPEVVYGGGSYTFTRQKIGTRYISQNSIKVEQKAPGRFEVPNWDPMSQKKVRDALLILGETVPDTRRMFGARDQVDPVRHLIGTAMAFRGNPERDALYLNVTPKKNDGVTIYRLTVKDVPVDGFWSVSVYDAQGHFHPNRFNAYTLNNITAKKKKRRFDRHPVRRLRRQDFQLPTGHKRVELYGASLSAARRDPERSVDLSTSRRRGLINAAYTFLPCGWRTNTA